MQEAKTKMWNELPVPESVWIFLAKWKEQNKEPDKKTYPVILTMLYLKQNFEFKKE